MHIERRRLILVAVLIGLGVVYLVTRATQVPSGEPVRDRVEEDRPA